MSIATAAQAGGPREVNLPAGRLGDAVIVLGRQAGVSIGISDSALARQRVRAVRGRLTARQALAELLRGLPARSISFGSDSFRIVRRAVAAAPRMPRIAPARPPVIRSAEPLAPIVALPEPEIIVTGTRRRVRLTDYPGVADIVAGDDPELDGGPRGSEALVARLPGISSTHLGPGRNKLFIRGIADSSFNGPTQAASGQYLGETRINYNAPDPDLRLHDIERIEVLHGPQGTLYGAGSLGGIIRIIPNRPRLDALEGEFGLGLTATQHGKPGADVAGTLNLPIVADRLGLRVAAYGAVDGGYIDDALRGEEDVNRVTTAGGRATLRLHTPSDWTLDLGTTVQRIRGDDGQFADRDGPPLTRRSAVEQPFGSNYLLADLVVAKSWDDVRLVSAFGYVRQDLSEQFDSTLEGEEPQLFAQDSQISLLSAETRLSGGGSPNFSWVIGAGFLSNEMDQRRRAGPAAAPIALPGVSNAINEASLFGEASFSPFKDLTATLGGRVTHSRLAGGGLEVFRTVLQPLTGPEANRNETALLPSFALEWDASRSLTLFARYQESFRPGGLSVSNDFIRRFRNDHVASLEGGFRWSPATSAFALAASAAYTRWSDIQADTISMDGFPSTANIGDGRIFSADARLTWRPVERLSIEAGMVLNESKVTDPQPMLMLARGSQLPNVADVSARLAASYSMELGGDLTLRLNGNARYAGRSTLGVGPVLGMEQGGWLDIGLGVRIERGDHAVMLNVTNLLDEVGNRFALGSPFTLFLNPQVTPMRPRTIRLGYQIRF